MLNAKFVADLLQHNGVIPFMAVHTYSNEQPDTVVQVSKVLGDENTLVLIDKEGTTVCLPTSDIKQIVIPSNDALKRAVDAAQSEQEKSSPEEDSGNAE